MSYFFHLYRAGPDSPPLLSWQQNHAAALGSLDDVRSTMAAALPYLAWSSGASGMWSGTGLGASGRNVTVHLRETQPGIVYFLSVDAAPPELREIMQALSLNFCCASESGAMKDPFVVGSAWQT